jgi:cystathionine beta-lyase
MSDFDRIIDRYNTNSLKYDFAVEEGYPPDVLPLWVADMDFQAPAPVLNALHSAVDHGIFGYSNVKGDYYAAVSRWFLSRYGWETQESWLVKTPGIVFALAMAVRALTAPGDSIMIQPPVYYPFFSVVKKNGRTLVENKLIYEEGRYRIDYEDFERRITDQDVKMFILCSPHNPIGRVWSLEELQRMGEICRKHHVFVVSDEIHCDFAFPEHPHHVFLEAVPELAERSIVCTAPSKTFNLAGLQVSNIWIPDKENRARFCEEMDRCGCGLLNTLGLTACQAAYENGGEWLEQCKSYLRENLDYLRSFLRERIAQIRLVEPEGTYFAWLDCSGLGLSCQELNDLIAKQAKLWLDAGHIFSPDSGQFQRIVLACPRSVLARALEQLETAIKQS